MRIELSGVPGKTENRPEIVVALRLLKALDDSSFDFVPARQRLQDRKVPVFDKVSFELVHALVFVALPD